MNKLPVASCAHRRSTDIDPTKERDSKEWDRLGNVCVVRATTTLQKDVEGFRKEHRDHISDIRESSRTQRRYLAQPRRRIR